MPTPAPSSTPAPAPLPTLSFRDRHVVITGGTGALGSSVVKLILAGGGTCHIPCVEPRELERFEFRGHERVRVSMGGEMTDEAVVAKFYDAVPGLWASIHCAGGFLYSPIADTTLANVHDMLNTNALTCFLCCREAVRRMRSASVVGTAREGRGRIVNVTARPALEARAGANMTAYSMSKAAVATLTTALAEEVVADGIFVNAVVPSIMDTRANRRAMPDADFSKWATLDEVAATIAFLASPENASTRGGLVPVYGRC
ncbi:MAG: SDR family NAD(P)-dependent oxidoreductase [Phycisphaerales bacterium]